MSAPLPLVEALAGFFADPAARDERIDQRRKSKRDPFVLVSEAFGEIAGDVSEHVEAGDVGGAEGGAFRPAERRTGHRIDLFDRVGARFEDAKHLQTSRTARCGWR